MCLVGSAKSVTHPHKGNAGAVCFVAVAIGHQAVNLVILTLLLGSQSHTGTDGQAVTQRAGGILNAGHIVADVERIDYINASKDFSEQEKLELGIKPLEGFYRHFRKMVLLAKSREEKEICLKCREWVIGLPGDYKLRRKFARMRNLLENHWRVFCLLNRLRLC